MPTKNSTAAQALQTVPFFADLREEDARELARESTREINGRPLPQQNTLHRSVVKLLIEDYEAGASTGTAARIGDTQHLVPAGITERMSPCPSTTPKSSATTSCA